ncbi:MAG TPA: MMPL family transporter [Thermoanaerobaculia bacterium]|nr:MMPL family transporter [Thermoanaerobaculia bacterium]
MASFEPLVRRRRLVILVYFAVAAACAPGLLRLRIDNSPEGFFLRDAAALERLQRLELDFGRDRAVRLVIEGEGLWTREGLARLAALEEATADPRRATGGVYGVAGLYSHHRWHLPVWPPTDPKGFRELVLADPLDRSAGWVSRDGRAVTVLAGLFGMAPERREATLEALQALLPESQGFVAGLPVLNQAVDDALAELAGRLLPAALLAAVVLLLVLFRRPAVALLPLALVAVSQTVLFGAMGYAGQRLDVVTMILAPLVFVIALATGVHVLAYHRRMAASGAPERAPEQAVLATYRVKAWPVLWTGLTTCVGFGSLAVAGTPPVRMLGLWAAFGIAYQTLAALSFYPALLASVSSSARAERPPHPDPLPPRAGGEGTATHSELETVEKRELPLPRDGGEGRGEGGAGRRLSRLGRSWASWAVAHRGVVFAAFGAVALVAALGLPRLALETSVLELFEPDRPVRARIAELEELGIGAVSASLVLAAPEGTSLGEPEALRRLAALAAELRADPLVLGAVSAGDLAGAVARYAPPAERSPETDRLAASRARLDREPDLSRLLGTLEISGGERTRVIVFTRMRGHRELAPLYRRAEELARRAFPEAAVWTTGQYPMILAGQRSLLRTLVASLSVTSLLIAGILRWLLGSAALTLRALAPNAWTVLLVLGAMGWLGLPVDGATVMLAAVVLGLAVDDTLHGLGHFRRLVGAGERGLAPDRAVVETLAETAPGHVSTSLVLALGFAVCALSSLVPIARFGALAVLGLAGALAADLLLLPALLAGAPERAVARLSRERP